LTIVALALRLAERLKQVTLRDGAQHPLLQPS
jgi:hypothetical protein